MIKIAHIGIKGLPAQAGADSVVEMLASRISERYEITIYCSQRFTHHDVILPNVRLIKLPSLLGKYTRMTSVDFLAAWHAVLWGNYDLIHLHTIEACFILPILILRYPVIVTAHGRVRAHDRTGKWPLVPAVLMQSMEIPFAYLSDARTSVSRHHANQLETQYHRPVFYIPNGADPDPVLNIEAARNMLIQQGLPEGGYILFAAGRLLPFKGAHVLMDAHRRLDDPPPLVILGGLNHAPNYTSQLVRKASSNTTFLPFIAERPVLLGCMHLCMLFVFPSMQEAMSMTLLEAASVGAPIICADIPANRAVLPNQALYFASGDAADLSVKLRWALDNPQEMAMMGKSAQAWVSQQFNWDNICRQYESLYRRVAHAD